MTYATEIVNNYRMALRNLWNGHYWVDQRFRDSDTVRAFKKIQLPIYEALVHSRLEPLGQPAKSVFGDGFRIATSHSHSDQIPVLQRIGGNFELIQGPFKIPPLKLTLLDFFDWSEHDWRTSATTAPASMHLRAATT